MVLATDVDDVQLGVGAISQINGSEERQLGVLGAVGGKKYLRRKDTQFSLLVRHSEPDITIAPCLRHHYRSFPALTSIVFYLVILASSDESAMKNVLLT